MIGLDIGIPRDRKLVKQGKDKNVAPLYSFPRQPTTSDRDYAVGSVWRDSIGLKYYQLVDFNSGNAVWLQLSADTYTTRFKDKDGIVVQPIGEEVRVLGEGATTVRVDADAIITGSSDYIIEDETGVPAGYKDTTATFQKITQLVGEDGVTTESDGSGVMVIRGPGEAGENNNIWRDEFGNTAVPTIDNELFHVGEGDINAFISGSRVITGITTPTPVDPTNVFPQLKQGLRTGAVVNIDMENRKIIVGAGEGYSLGVSVVWDELEINLPQQIGSAYEGYLLVVKPNVDPNPPTLDLLGVAQLLEAVRQGYIWVSCFYFNITEVRFLSNFSERINDVDALTLLGALDAPYTTLGADITYNVGTGGVGISKLIRLSKLISVVVAPLPTFEQELAVLYVYDSLGKITINNVLNISGYGIVGYGVIPREEINNSTAEIIKFGFLDATFGNWSTPADAMTSFQEALDVAQVALYHTNILLFGLVLDGNVIQIQGASKFGQPRLSNSIITDNGITVLV